MGFYGNITNTSNTTFQFDRIYPNRLTMDANANNDGIFIGRYVLVEYQEDAAYPVALGRKETSTIGKYYLYTSTEAEDQTVIKYLGDVNSSIPGESDLDNKDNKDGVYEKEIIQYTDPKDNKIKFYICQNSDGGSVVNGPAIFKETVLSTTSQYIQNFNIDETHYGQGSKGFKGYDSTVWTKVSDTLNGQLITKYVNIADLNSVVPTFAITADAPTMKPITPHFDSDSTNVYYELHAQPQWGFRVAQADGTNSKSDTTTQWETAEYDPATDIKSTKYGSGINEDGITEWSETPTDIEAAIYYNAAGFKKQLVGTDERQGDIKKHDDAIQDVIKIMPTGKSGATYEAHNGTKNKVPQEDIQELTIQLPSIGNMMSDAWDIIHGPNRDDDMRETDEDENRVDSLQGRLNSIAAIEKNQIPIKRIDNGQLVGTKINGGIHSTITDNFNAPVIKDDFTQDDAWIKTQVNADNTPNAISIHHTFKSTPDSASEVDKNDNTNNQSGENYKEDYLEDKTNVIEEHQDKIKLYVPYVDATGHVVGKNIETVTLPYGYKTITTNGRGEDTEINTFDKVAAKTQNIVAENTQDELAINSGNEWIRIDTDAINDILTISHDIHKTSSDSHDTDWTQTEANTTIPTTSYEFDNAGHYVSHHTENYKLPFGYGKVVGDTGSSAATATYDQIKFTSDEWLTATVTEEGEDNTTVITYNHDYPNVQEDTSTDFDMNTATTQDNKDKIVLETLRHDNTGHIINVNQHTVTLPYSYKTIKVANNSNGVAAPASTVVEAGQSADQTQDTLNLNASNKWIVLDNAEDDIIKFGHKLSDLPKGWHSSSDTTIGEFGQSFKILKYETDEAGHIINSGEDTITIPKGSLNDLIETGSSVLTGISMVDETGAITQTNADVGTLKLEKYNQGTTGALKIETSDTINGAFQNIQTYINTLDMPESNSTTQFITSIKQVDGQLTVSRANAGTLVLGTDSTDKTVVAEDSLNSAINKIEARIIAEERNRSDAIDALTGTKDYSEHFDTMKEIADWLDANKDGVVDITLNVAANAHAISTEQLRATAKENEINAALTGEINRATVAEQELQNQISALGTASTKAIEDFATATQGSTADTTAATIATYGDIVTYKAEDFVSKEEYNALLEDYNELKELVEKLNNQINPPQEPDEGGETI